MENVKSFYPWKRTAGRNPLKVTGKRQYSKRGPVYQVMSDGSLRNPNADRHERKFYGLSARQHRKLKKRTRRDEKSAGPSGAHSPAVAR